MTNRRRFAGFAIVLGLLSVVAAGAAVAAAGQAVAGADGEQLWATLPAGDQGIPADAPLDMSSFARLSKQLKPAVVNISVTAHVRMGRSYGDRRDFYHRFFGRIPEEFENKGLGSGFVINERGYILTNNHVIENADEITVKFADGTSYPARVVGADQPTDTALLKIEPKAPLAVAPLGDSDALEVGEWVLAIGNPFGLSHTVTAGIVSAKGRKDVQPGGRPMIANFIQTDASINPGNSGGPLFNIRGEVVGMNTAINASGQGIGFAIPVNMLKTLIPQLEQGKVARSWLGVMIRPVTEAHVAALGLPAPKGAIVERIVPDSPAARGGLKAGDVIVAFDGKPVDTSVDLQWLASTAGAGTRSTVDVFRSGERQQLQLVLEAMPDKSARGGRPGLRGPRSKSADQAVPGVGIRVSDVSSSLKKRLRLPARTKGAVVTDVDAGSPAHQGGLKVGDVILVVGTQKVANARAFRSAVERVKPGQLVSLVVLRDGATRFLDFRRGR